MRLRLESKWTDRLLKFPESGIGFQRVRVKLTNGRVIDPAVVLNAEMLEIADDVPSFAPAEILQIDLSVVRPA